MKSEYKRDINGNYLVLYENEEPDTSSYQMRMLVGNSIPSILKCRVQGVDGQFMVCYDITSKQSLLSLYEEKKMGYEDLQMILGGFVQVMEDMSEYLLNPCRLVLKPEYMYVDVEKRQIYFCYLPGYDEDVRQKFQELTEYILPILDHEDSKAVMLGYGIYRRALEDSFHLEYIKKELYQDREEIEKTVGSSILQESGTMTEKRCNSDGSEKIDLFENYGESKEEKPQEEHLEELLWEEELSEKKKKDVEIEPLLTTSKKSYVKEGENKAVSKESGDKSGPFNIAVSVKDKSNDSKLIVTGCSYYLVEPNVDSMVNGANATFVISGLNWLNDQSDNIYISPKDIMTETVVVDEASASKLKILAWAVIPAIIFVIGFAVWAVRRNK